MDFNPGQLICRQNDGKEIFKIALSFGQIPPEEVLPPGSPSELPLSPSRFWAIVSFPWPDVFPVMIMPGILDFCWSEGDGLFELGKVLFFHAPAQPLSAERIAAIKSDPRAAKSARLTLSCIKCNKTLKTYSSFERLPEDKAEGFTWYKDLPDQFRCDCGTNEIPLILLRENLHSLLGQRLNRPEEEISFTRVYEQGALETIYERLRHLLDKDPEEEAIQKFFTENPVLLHVFSPEKIFSKAPILTKHFTDFITLSKSGHLRLIELERAGKRLLKKDGGRTSELTQACDQVLNWHHEFSLHRLAILDTLNLQKEEVTKVSGVVIIGRDEGHNRSKLLRLKSADLGGVELFTYDDILANLESLIRNITEL
jgi:Domain of unknown function (DUF4263)